MRVSTCAKVGIAGIAPFFSTQRLATALPNLAYSTSSSFASSCSRFSEVLILYKNPPQKESPAPFVSPIRSA